VVVMIMMAAQPWYLRLQTTARRSKLLDVKYAANIDSAVKRQHRN
jgi:hypothetical protein